MTTETLMKDKVVEMKKNKVCALCGKEIFVDGCTIQVVEITESGQVVAPYENKESAMSLIIPVCAYHMVLAQEGLIATTMKGQIIQSKLLTMFEPKTDMELKKMLQALQRADKSEQMTRGIKAILGARKFQQAMSKEKNGRSN